jgi:solute carrier family 1 (high affinity glutamate transporter) protein 2
LKTNILLVLTVLGVFLGGTLGFCGRLMNPSKETVELVFFPGDLLMRMLKMLILPLIISSLITGKDWKKSSSFVKTFLYVYFFICKGMAQLDAKSSGRMGSRALLYYMVTTILAAIVGIIMVVAIHPGDPSIKQNMYVEPTSTPVSTMDALLDIARLGHLSLFILSLINIMGFEAPPF